MQQQRIRIKFSSYEFKSIDTASKNVLQAVRDVRDSDVKVRGPLLLPTRISKFCVNKGPHIDKKSREQFEIRKYKCLIDIDNATPSVVENLMQLSLPAGVETEIRI